MMLALPLPPNRRLSRHGILCRNRASSGLKKTQIQCYLRRFSEDFGAGVFGVMARVRPAIKRLPPPRRAFVGTAFEMEIHCYLRQNSGIFFRNLSLQQRQPHQASRSTDGEIDADGPEALSVGQPLGQ